METAAKPFPVMVTGGAGYIGSHAVLALLDAGWQVVVFDNLATGFRWAVPDAAEFVQGDVADLETVAYGDNPNPHETLFNSAGLPASPFTVNPVTSALFDGDAACLAPPQLLGLQDAKVGVVLHISHVRRSGYVFQPKPKGNDKTAAPVTVQAYIPAEWKGFEVEAGGKRLEVTTTTKDGTRFITFNAPMDETWIIVAEAGKAAGFRNINRF